MLFRQSFRIKKRSFVVMGICFLVVALIASFAAWRAAGAAHSANVARYRLNVQSSRDPIIGTGLNVQQADLGSFVLNGSFEPSLYRSMFALSSWQDERLYVTSVGSEDMNAAPTLTAGAGVSIYSNDQEDMILKTTGQILSSRKNRAEAFHLLKQSPDFPRHITWSKGDSYDGVFWLTGSGGYVLRLASEADVRVLNTGLSATISDLVATAEGVMAVSEDGGVAFSTDGQTFSSVLTPDGTPPLRAVAAILHPDTDAWRYVVVGDRVTVLVGSASDLSLVEHLPVETDLTTITSYQERFYLGGKQNALLTSADGYAWESIAHPDEPADWLDIAVDGFGMLVAGTGGRLLHAEPQGELRLIEQRVLAPLFGIDPDALSKIQHNRHVILWPDITNCMLLSNDYFLASDVHGRFFFSEDRGMSWQLHPDLSGETVEGLSLWPSRFITVTTRDGEVWLAPVTMELVLDDLRSSVEFQAGDLVFVEQMTYGLSNRLSGLSNAKADLPTGEWYSKGPVIPGLDPIDAAPGGGRTSLRLDKQLTGNLQEPGGLAHWVGLYTGEQRLLPEKLMEGEFALAQNLMLHQQQDAGDRLYRLEFYIRQEGGQDTSLTISFAGNTAQSNASPSAERMEKNNIRFCSALQLGQSE